MGLVLRSLLTETLTVLAEIFGTRLSYVDTCIRFQVNVFGGNWN